MILWLKMCEVGTLQLSMLRDPRHTDGKCPC